MYDVIIIGAGLAGLECARSLLSYGISNILILEKNPEIGKLILWKTFEPVIRKFHLEDCVSHISNQTIIRTINLREKSIQSQNIVLVKGYLVDSVKLYAEYVNWIQNCLCTGMEVTSIKKTDQQQFILGTSSGDVYRTRYLVDASGIDSVTDTLLDTKKFTHKAFYSCYAYRFTRCDTRRISDSTFFDFESPFGLCGAWCFIKDKQTIEIGVARLKDHFEMDKPDGLKKMDNLLKEYIQLAPFDQALEKAEFQSIVRGYIPLMPRTAIQNGNRFFCGDSAGAIAFSGAGFRNSLESGRSVSESIALGKKHSYYIIHPAYSLALLSIIWRFKPDELVRLIDLSRFFSNEDLIQLITGHVNMALLNRINMIVLKNGVNPLTKIPIGLQMKILLKIKPSRKDYLIFYRK